MHRVGVKLAAPALQAFIVQIMSLLLYRQATAWIELIVDFQRAEVELSN